MNKNILKLFAIASILSISAHSPPDTETPCFPYELTLNAPDSLEFSFIRVPCIYEENWHRTNEVKFWREVITTQQDSFIANVHSTREILEKIPRTIIDSLDRDGLNALRKSINMKYGLDTSTRILFTSGKSWFYNYTSLKSDMKTAIRIFENMGVDPFYAQAVLLVESPGSANNFSYSGAYGKFQLMPSVARQYGLTVNKYTDDRRDFSKSAVAAARLFQDACIPYAKRWLTDNGFEVNENALWFKLIALHIYNAGAGNVKSAIAAIPNHLKGKEIVEYLWHVQTSRFRNESQNYSQLALACYLEYEKDLLMYDISQIRDINF